MTEYTPFAEPFTENIEVIRRRTWEELRRVGTTIGTLSQDPGNGGGSGAAGYATGYTSNVQNWAPGVTTPALNTRIPFQTVTTSAGVTAGAETLTPIANGDYVFDARLTFSPNGNNEIWYAAIFQNDTQISVTLEINNESLTTRYPALLAAITASAGDQFNLRLWPQFDIDTGTITLCEFSLRALSSEVLPTNDHEQRISDLENLTQTHETEITQLQADVTNLQTRVSDLEQIQQVLVDGVYGSGSTSDLPWNPGVSSPTNATRVPIGIYTVESNVNALEFTIQPLFDADYLVDLAVTFTGDQNNRDWTIAIFENGAQAGQGFEFNTRDSTRVHVSASFGLHMTASDVLDVRIWPTNASSTGTINDYTSNLILLGLDDTIT